MDRMVKRVQLDKKAVEASIKLIVDREYCDYFTVNEKKLDDYKENYFRLYYEKNEHEFMGIFFDSNGEVNFYEYQRSLFSRRLVITEHGEINGEVSSLKLVLSEIYDILVNDEYHKDLIDEGTIPVNENEKRLVQLLKNYLGK
jgi:hypothetical protein